MAPDSPSARPIGSRVIRSAPLADLPPLALHDILKIRADVFVVEQDCAYPDLDGRDTEPGATQFWVELAGEVVACLRRLVDADGATRIGRIATRADHRGEGLAAALIEAALADTDGDAVLDAQEQLEAWYGRLGFVRSGATYLDDGIAHVPMRRPAAASR